MIGATMPGAIHRAAGPTVKRPDDKWCTGTARRERRCRFRQTRTKEGREDMSLKKAALVVGIEDYPGSWLPGCVRDILAKKVDMALMYFSGHGIVTARGGFLVTQDWKAGDEGVGMHEIVEYANDSKIPQITIIVDACFSGKLGAVPAIKE